MKTVTVTVNAKVKVTFDPEAVRAEYHDPTIDQATLKDWVREDVEAHMQLGLNRGAYDEALGTLIEVTVR